MRFEETEISCGIMQLVGVGNNPTDQEYRAAFADTNDYGEKFTAAVVIASVPAKWTTAVKFLKRKGFKQAHKQITNPNSGNKIVLLSRTFSAKERAKFNLAFCQHCEEEIPKGRRSCDGCKEDIRSNRCYY